MLVSLLTLGLLGIAHATPTSQQSSGHKYIDWRSFKGQGVNLGAWLEQERNFDVKWWAANVGNYTDEWSWCTAVGAKVCGPILEKKYRDFITKRDIDKLAKLNINVLRIPTTYAVWKKIPGSRLYTGDQQKVLRSITDYAIDKYGMHIILGLHSLPGGTNGLDIGEAFGHNDWFFNSTNLQYSYEVADEVLKFVKASGKPNAFTIAPLNEPADNPSLFARPAGLTDNGTAWINTYITGVLSRIQKLDSRIPLMLQDAFQGESHWSSYYSAATNVVFDTHIYFFAVPDTSPSTVIPAICSRAQSSKGDGKFPVFIGEWSLQVLNNNTLNARKDIFDAQRYAYSTYAAGSSFWNYKMINDVDTISGQGYLQDYWSYTDLVDAAVVTAASNTSYC